MTTKTPDLVQSVRLPLSKLQPNNGQIAGLPKNPRFIRDEKFKKLVKSIEDNPEMTALREVLVYPHAGKYVIIGGNMRYQALKELGYKEAICKVLPENTTPEQLQAYAIKDNAGFGEWDFDLLGNEWDAGLLCDWGVDVPNVDTSVPIGGLPAELQGRDIMPDELPDIQGDGETAVERIIIVFPKERAGELAELLGVEELKKTLYRIEEFIP